jgi:hypothetical protein
MTAKDIEDLGISKKGHVKNILLSIEVWEKICGKKEFNRDLLLQLKKDWFS